MALNKLKFNSINVTPAASEAIRFNSSASGLETASAGGSLVKIASTTASSSSSISFTSGIDSTYKEYIFILNNIHPATDNVIFHWNGSIDGGSNYNVTKTTTNFESLHGEGGSSGSLGYNAGGDLAQSTSYHKICGSIGGGNDESVSGFFHLFEPSSTTFVKHFIARTSAYFENDLMGDTFIAGYLNTTSAINALDFKMSSGNIDSGTIDMYGVL